MATADPIIKTEPGVGEPAGSPRASPDPPLVKRIQLPSHGDPERNLLDKEKLLELWAEQDKYIDHLETLSEHKVRKY